MLAARASLVAIFLLGQLGGLVHHAATSHSRCAEHGELVHGDQLNGPGTVEVEDASRLVTGHAAPDVAREFPNQTRHEHEHCSIPCASHERATEREPVPTIGALDEARPQSIPLIADAAAPRLALYRTAPKTSPPA